MALVVCLLLACTGCQLQLRVDLEVNRDGGGVFSLVTAADAELEAAARDAGADPLGDLLAAGEQLEGWRVDEGEHEGFRTVTLSAAFENPSELEALTAQVSEALNGPEATLLEPFSVAVTSDEVRVEGGASATPERGLRDMGISPQAALRRIERADAFSYQVRVLMPGAVRSENTNAPSPPADPRLVWQVEPGEAVDITAASTRPGPPILRAAAGAAGGALLAGLVLWLLARRRRAPRRGG